jgi:general secretion pathway protein A
LQENPFSDSANPRFFYRTEVHEEACIRMMLAVRHNVSLGLVTGRSGTGKTLVSQVILKELTPDRYVPALVLVSPAMSRTALLREILGELRVPAPEGPFVRTQELLRLLHERVIDEHGKGRKIVLLIDECHFLSAESLHIIRTISNIEVPDRKLTTCILFAEDRFLQRLEHPGFESLRTRMYLRGELTPLTGEPCAQYVKFRLLVAGGSDELFSVGALGAIHRHAGGICRRVNKIGMLALVETFLRGRSRITEETIETCAAKL